MTPSCLQLQAPEPAGRVAEPLPLPRGGAATHWLGLCRSRAGPVSCVCGLSASSKSGCPLRGALEGKGFLQQVDQSPEPQPAASALWPLSWCVASRAGPVGLGLRGQRPPGSPAQQRPAVLTDREQRAVHSFGWVAPAGKAAQAETRAQISGGAHWPRTPVWALLYLAPGHAGSRQILASPGVPWLRTPQLCAEAPPRSSCPSPSPASLPAPHPSPGLVNCVGGTSRSCHWTQSCKGMEPRLRVLGGRRLQRPWQGPWNRLPRDRPHPERRVQPPQNLSDPSVG